MSRPWYPGQRSLKVVETGTLDRLCMVSYYCHIVTLSVSFWDIRLQKCRDLEDRVRGPSRSFEMSPFDRESTTYYWCSRVVSEIFNVEKYRDLEIPVKGQSRPLNISYYLIDWLVFYSNFSIFKGRAAEIFNFKNAVILKTGLWVRQGHWKCHHSIERIWLPIDVL